MQPQSPNSSPQAELKTVEEPASEGSWPPTEPILMPDDLRDGEAGVGNALVLPKSVEEGHTDVIEADIEAVQVPYPHIRLAELQSHVNWVVGRRTRIYRKGGRCAVQLLDRTILHASTHIELLITIEQHLLNEYLLKREASLKMKTADIFECINKQCVVLHSAPWEFWTQFMVDHRKDTSALTFDSFA